MKNFLLASLLAGGMYSAHAASVLAGLKSGEIQDARQVVVLLQKQAAEQKSGEKELTEFLITAIKDVYTAEYRLKEARKQRQSDLNEAEKQEKAAKKWLEPNALGSTSPGNAEACMKKAEMLRGRSIRSLDDANDQLKEKLAGLQEAEDYLWDAGRKEDSLVLKKVGQTMSKQLKTGGGVVSFWGRRERKKNPFGASEAELMPRNSAYQLQVVSGEGSFELTRRLRRKVDDAMGKELSAEGKDKLVKDVKTVCLFSLQEMEDKGGKVREDVVYILLEEFEALAVDGIQALKWAQILEKASSPSYQKYGETFTRKLLDKLSMDYHDTAQTTYKSWMGAKEGKGDDFWQFYQAYGGKTASMIRLNCSRDNAAYWLQKARDAGHPEAMKISGTGTPSRSRDRRSLPNDSEWWK